MVSEMKKSMHKEVSQWPKVMQLVQRRAKIRSLLSCQYRAHEQKTVSHFSMVSPFWRASRMKTLQKIQSNLFLIHSAQLWDIQSRESVALWQKA